MIGEWRKIIGYRISVTSRKSSPCNYEALVKFKINGGFKPELFISQAVLSLLMGIANEPLVRTLADFKTER